MNRPPINGVEQKRQINKDEELKRQCLPFVFFSAATSKSTVNEAYKKLTVRGIFQILELCRNESCPFPAASVLAALCTSGRIKKPL